MSTSLSGGTTSNLDALAVVGATTIGSTLAVTGAADFGTPTYGTVAMPRMVMMTAQATTSGTTVSFTGIPSWAKRITITAVDVSGSAATSNIRFRVRVASADVASGYSVTQTTLNTAPTSAAVSQTTEFGGINFAAATDAVSNQLNLIKMSSTLWSINGSGFRSGNSSFLSYSGSVTVAGDIDGISILCLTAGAFDAGTVNVMYEG